MQAALAFDFATAEIREAATFLRCRSQQRLLYATNELAVIGCLSVVSSRLVSCLCAIVEGKFCKAGLLGPFQLGPVAVAETERMGFVSLNSTIFWRWVGSAFV